MGSGKDFVAATAPALSPTQKFMSIWRSPKPVIAQVHGWCVGGGSDYALAADLVIACHDARIRDTFLEDVGVVSEQDVDLPSRPDQVKGICPHR